MSDNKVKRVIINKMKELKDVLNCFEIVLKNPNGAVISQEFLIKKLWDFLCADYDKGIIFNPGSSYSCMNPEEKKLVPYFGEDIYLAVLLVYSALDSIYKSTGMTENYIRNLQPGTPVTYSEQPKTKYFFKHLEEKKHPKMGIVEYAVLEAKAKESKSKATGENSFVYVPKSLWSQITGDNGNLKKTDKRNQQDFSALNKFLTECLSFDESEIPSEVNYSTLFEINDKAKEKAKDIINNVCLKYKDCSGNLDFLSLKNLTNSAYYTKADKPEYYSGKANGQEPAIKITTNPEVLQDLRGKRYRENEVSRIIVADSMIWPSRCAGILSLLNDNKKVIVETDYSFISRLKDVLEMPDFKKPDFDKEKSLAEKKIKVYIPDGNLISTENVAVKQLSPVTEVFKWQADDIRDKKTECIPVKTDFSMEEDRELKSLLFKIKSMDVLSDNKDFFIVKAFFIRKTLAASILSVQDLKRFVDLDLEQAYEELKQIQLPEYGDLKATQKRCVELLGKLLNSRRNDNARSKKLEKLLFELNASVNATWNAWAGSSESAESSDIADVSSNAFVPPVKKFILIIVHNKYLQLALEKWLENFEFAGLDITVETGGKVKNKRYFDLIISGGCVPYDCFNIFDINFTEKLVVLCADYQEKEFAREQKKAEKTKNKWKKASAFDLKNAVEPDDGEAQKNDEPDVPAAADGLDGTNVTDGTEGQSRPYISEEELSKLIKNLLSKAGTSDNPDDDSDEPINNSRDVTAKTWVCFDDDSFGLFTEGYKVNVLRQDEATSEYEVSSIKVEDLTEGDDVIFMERHGKRHEAIREVQNYLLDAKVLPQEMVEAVRFTQEWRSALIDYVKNKFKHESKDSIAARCNVSLTEFNNWLALDFYIVGPDKKSVAPIGNLICSSYICDEYKETGKLMMENPERFTEYSDIVKKLHSEIRKAFAKAIIAKEKGEKPNGEYEKIIYNKIGNLEDVRRVQSKMGISRKVNSSLINHPVPYIREEVNLSE